MEKSKVKDKIKQMKIDEAKNFLKKHSRYFAAAALFIVMIIVLATCAGKENENNLQSTETGSMAEEGYQVDAFTEVNNLIKQYYVAYAEGDTAALADIASPISANEQSYIEMFSQYVETYQNISCHTKSGLDDKSYLVSVEMEIKFADVDTAAPGLDFFYVRTNEEGTLYIDNLYSQYNLSNQENALDTSVQNLIYGFENSEDFVNLQNDVQTRYDNAIASDEKLSTMIYTTIPEAIEAWVKAAAEQETTETGETEATETTEEPEEEPAGETEEAPAEEAAAETYYTVDKVNVRAQAGTDGEKLASLEKGTAVDVFGTADGWSHIKYNGQDGYIKSEYLAKEAPDMTAESNEAESAGGSLAEGTVIMLEETVNIRSGMNETSERIGTAYAGEKVKVVMSYAEGWTKVTWNDKTGYIKTSLLQ